ncbi:MAG: DUF362 domain-containing protein [Clostridia bacterium]|nr:DUF362 domain-containing protein [Clostridia bacterium]
MATSKVYFTSDISSAGLFKVYNALEHGLNGRVAVKISTGEPGGHNFLNPNLIEPLVSALNGTIVECLTAYRGKRFNAKDHWQAIKDHGFADIAPCDIMDEFAEINIPVDGGTHLKGYNIVGDHLQNYDSMLVLSHFKGHQMAGMGGALKNLSIGVASKTGKTWIHSVGRTMNPDELWAKYTDDQDGFLESMAEACKAVINYMNPENMLYINVANNLSVDCDCDSNPADPEMHDIGIFASTDPVALDKCCYDQIINSSDYGKKALIERMQSRHAIHVVEAAEELGIGTTDYEVVYLDTLEDE